jgi:hypothetical protein
MRELIVTQKITLDGVIDAAGGWFDVSGRRGPTSRTLSRRLAGRWRPPTRSSLGV